MNFEAHSNKIHLKIWCNRHIFTNAAKITYCNRFILQTKIDKYLIINQFNCLVISFCQNCNLGVQTREQFRLQFGKRVGLRNENLFPVYA